MNPRHRALLAIAAVLVLGGGGVAFSETHHTASLSPAEATSQWASTNQFSGGVVALLRDARWVDHAIAADQASLTNYCLYLYTDAQGENTDLLVTPDRQLTGLLSSAFDGFVQASAVCDEHSASRPALDRVTAEVGRSVTELTEAVLREEAVTGTSLRVRGIP